MGRINHIRPRSTSANRHRFLPEMEALEDRRVPVVGATAVPVEVLAGEGYDGVVQVFHGGGTCTGTLLPSGRHILTAGHCFDGDSNGIIDPGTTTIQFDLPFGPIFFGDIANDKVAFHPSFRGLWTGGPDLAIVELPDVAPMGAERFDIYRGADEVGRAFQIVGYGLGGTGTSGANQPAGIKRFGFNQYGAAIAPNSLTYDFDDGSAGNDMIGDGRGLGIFESSGAPGDSGGPTFLDGQIAGVNSWGFFRNNWGFGTQSFVVRVSSVAGFIHGMQASPYDLIVDMNRQPGGNNGLPDTLRASLAGSQIRVYLNDVLVHQDLQTQIRSIKLHGSGDADTFIVGLGLDAPVSVDGRDGGDVLRVNGTDKDDGILYWHGSVAARNQAMTYRGIEDLRIFGFAGKDDILAVPTLASEEENPLTSISLEGGSEDDRLMFDYNLLTGIKPWTFICKVTSARTISR
jgi:hypothetical protein